MNNEENIAVTDDEEVAEWGRWMLPNETIAHFASRDAYNEDADELSEMIASMAAELLWFREELDIKIHPTDFPEESWKDEEDGATGQPN